MSTKFNMNDALQKIGIEWLSEKEMQENHFTETFVKAVEMLNQEQLQAVQKTDGPIMVVAGPGTGKTQILSTRIGKILLEADIQPENILCLTFTDAGTVAMKKRLGEFLGTKATEIGVYTFHSFCNKLINENQDLINKGDYTIITDLERRLLIKEIIREVEFNTPLKKRISSIDHSVRLLEKFFSECKKEHYTVETFLKLIEKDAEIERLDKAKYEYQRKYKEFNPGDLKLSAWNDYLEKIEKTKQAIQLYQRFQEKMEANQWMEMDDLILKVLDTFKENEDFRMRYQEKFQYILIDEFQDTNGSQLEIAQWLCYENDYPNIMIVGDDDQSIYRFQGANIGNIFKFYEQYIQPLGIDETKERIIILKDNYRSTATILEASQQVIENNMQRIVHLVDGISLNKNLEAKGAINKEKLPLELIQCNTKEAEYVYLAERIEALKSKNQNLKEVAVLFHANATATEFSKILDIKKIPYEFTRANNILESTFILNLYHFLKYIQAEKDKSFEREDLLAESFFYEWNAIKPLEISKVLLEYRAYKATDLKNSDANLRTFMNEYDHTFRIKKYVDTTELLLQKSSNESVERFVERCIDKLQITQWISTQPNALMLFQELDSFRAFLKEQVEANPKLDLAAFIELISMYIAEEIPIQLIKKINQPNAVQLMTIHGSKGLEYEYVYIHGNNESTPRRNNVYIPKAVLYKDITDWDTILQAVAEQEQNEIEEQRRKFYVGLTRAKKQLLLTYFIKEQSTNSKDRSKNPLKFLLEIPETHLQKKEYNLSEEDYMKLMQINQEELESYQNYVYENGYLDTIIQNMKLSVSALNSYLECPKGFYFTKMLNIPQFSEKNLEIGNIFHNALENFFKTMKETKEIPSEMQLMEMTLQELNKRKRAFNDYEYDDTLAYIQKILPIYYQSESSKWTPNMAIEDWFESKYQGETLVGKIDKIDWMENGMANIIDFKTGKYENAKKKLKPPVTLLEGENPEDLDFEKRYGGNYWRQAVFYKMLFKSNFPNISINSITFDFIFPDDDIIHKAIVEVSPEEEAIVGNQIMETMKQIRAKNFEGCGKEECDWCQNK
jgi:DNA helicase-2/ATP-dependent DNA helicase PcrA